MPLLTARSPGLFAWSVLVLAATSQSATAQCTTQWVPTAGLPGTDGVVHASTVWDPDGGGPAGPRFVVGGSFTIACTTLAANVAVWDPATDTWSGLGTGMNGWVTALAGAPNGDLFAAGTFSSAGGVAANGIARWNGTAWTPLGSGSPNSSVEAFTFLPNGDVVVVGNFSAIGGIAASKIARWDGSAWSPLGSGIAGLGVYGVATLPNGHVVAAGSFSTAGGVVANNIARWDGSTWSPLGTGITFTQGSGVIARCLAVLPNGDLVAAGTFDTAGGVSVNNTARWDGASWSAMGAPGLPIRAMTVQSNGEVFVGHNDFNNPPARISRWDGASWHVVATLQPTSFPPPSTFLGTLASLPNGEIAVTGEFLEAGGQPALRIARWNGSWVPFERNWGATASPTSVGAFTTLANGDLVVGGSFTATPDGPANSIARWNGSAWSPMGNGFPTGVPALTAMPNGDVVAGGPFGVSRWSGSSWTSLGAISGTLANAYRVAALPNGDLVAAGRFTSIGGVAANNIARWDGATWSALGAGITGSSVMVHALLVLPNGDLVVGGRFGGGVRRWDGVSWSGFGAGIQGVDAEVHALCVLPNGDLVVGGYFPTAGGVPANGTARWDGTSWSALGSGTNSYVRALLALPNGDVIAGGDFTVAGGVPAPNIARWDGTSWSSLASGPTPPVGHGVSALHSLPDGEVLVGGNFTTMGGIVNPYLARLTTTCPATVTTFGVGCAESNGPDVLTANNLPWMDATFRATATGLPTVAIVLTLTSVTPIPQGVAPLTLAFPQAGIGCDVLTMLDLLGLIITNNGTAESQFFLPSSSPLIGLSFYHQLVSIEVDPQGAWTSVTATNALQLVAGSF